jgi:AraC family cel operon transcriptional repressor
MKRLLMRDFLPPGASCHFHRTRLQGGTVHTSHQHDFYEIFWIEQGQGWERLNGTLRPVRPGTVALVHSEDDHGLGGDGSGPCRLANLAFPIASWEEMRRRCFPDRDPFALDAQRRFDLGPEAIDEIAGFLDELEAGERGRAALDRFLLNVMRVIARSQRASPAPVWLRDAVGRLREPELLRRGTHALVSLCRRSPEHIAREARRCFGKTPTDLVNDARIAWAARRLAASEDPILDICLECGLSNLGHFYRLFRERHHTSPQKWRERQRRIVQG